MTAGPDAGEFALADWRRRVGELYAEVRRLARTDPPAAHAAWREARLVLYRSHPQSPVPAAERPTFRAHHFPYDPAFRFELALEPVPEDTSSPTRAPVALPNSGGEQLRFRPLGPLHLPLPSGPRSLMLYWMEGYAGGLFLPFRDATNGRQTYGAGRYVLDGAKGADLGTAADGGRLIVDLNFAYQPSCAFDPRWACPLAPPENRLDVPIRAGERLA